jgi:hypothetical protein
MGAEVRYSVRKDLNLYGSSFIDIEFRNSEGVPGYRVDITEGSSNYVLMWFRSKEEISRFADKIKETLEELEETIRPQDKPQKTWRFWK